MNYANCLKDGLSGEETEKNLTEAAFWFTLWFREGNEEAQNRLNQVNAILSDSEKLELQEWLDQWSRRRFG